MTDDIRRLLGGYATGTLTETERALLYEAALDDAELFEAMADEQALKDLLDNSSTRAELLAAVQDRPFSILGAFRDWFERPKSKVLVGVGALLLVTIGVKQAVEWRQERESRDVVAVLRPMDTAVQELPQTAAQQGVPPAQSAAPAEPRPRTAVERRKVPADAQLSPVLPAPLGMPPPPPPPAEIAASKPVFSAAEMAKAEAPMLTWSVLRVDRAGVASPVEAGYEFEAGEKARVRVEARQAGMLLARQGQEVLYAGTISPGLPVVLRRDIAISEEGEVPAVDLEWAPPVSASAVTASAPAPPPPPAPKADVARRSARPEGGTPGGVVGGVIGGVPSGQTMGFRASPVVDSVPAPARYRVRVQLQRKSH